MNNDKKLVLSKTGLFYLPSLCYTVPMASIIGLVPVRLCVLNKIFNKTLGGLFGILCSANYSKNMSKPSLSLAYVYGCNSVFDCI